MEKTTKTITEKLFEIQQRLEVKKNLENKFGGFMYRSLECILKAVKPLLKELKCVLTLEDQIRVAGNFTYIEAKAAIICIETNDANVPTVAGAYVSTVASAGIEERSGMSLGQCFGTSSSYARKYAVCALFAIDDGIDDDRFNKGPEKKATTPKPSYTEKKVEAPDFEFDPDKQNDEAKRKEVWEKLLALNDGNNEYAGKHLVELTTFTKSDGSTFQGFDDLSRLKDKWLTRVLLTVQKLDAGLVPF